MVGLSPVAYTNPLPSVVVSRGDRLGSDVGSDRCLPRLREPGGHGGTGLGLHHVAPRLLQNLLYLDRNYDALDEKGMAASTKRRFQL